MANGLSIKFVPNAKKRRRLTNNKKLRKRFRKEFRGGFWSLKRFYLLRRQRKLLKLKQNEVLKKFLSKFFFVPNKPNHLVYPIKILQNGSKDDEDQQKKWSEEINGNSTEVLFNNNCISSDSVDEMLLSNIQQIPKKSESTSTSSQSKTNQKCYISDSGTLCMSEDMYPVFVEWYTFLKQNKSNLKQNFQFFGKMKPVPDDDDDNNNNNNSDDKDKDKLIFEKDKDKLIFDKDKDISNTTISRQNNSTKEQSTNGTIQFCDSQRYPSFLTYEVKKPRSHVPIKKPESKKNSSKMGLLVEKSEESQKLIKKKSTQKTTNVDNQTKPETINKFTDTNAAKEKKRSRSMDNRKTLIPRLSCKEILKSRSKLTPSGPLESTVSCKSTCNNIESLKTDDIPFISKQTKIPSIRSSLSSTTPSKIPSRRDVNAKKIARNYVAQLKQVEMVKEKSALEPQKKNEKRREDGLKRREDGLKRREDGLKRREDGSKRRELTKRKIEDNKRKASPISMEENDGKKLTRKNFSFFRRSETSYGKCVGEEKGRKLKQLEEKPKSNPNRNKKPENEILPSPSSSKPHNIPEIKSSTSREIARLVSLIAKVSKVEAITSDHVFQHIERDWNYWKSILLQNQTTPHKESLVQNELIKYRNTILKDGQNATGVIPIFYNMNIDQITDSEQNIDEFLKESNNSSEMEIPTASTSSQTDEEAEKKKRSKSRSSGNESCDLDFDEGSKNSMVYTFIKKFLTCIRISNPSNGTTTEEKTIEDRETSLTNLATKSTVSTAAIRRVSSEQIECKTTETKSDKKVKFGSTLKAVRTKVKAIKDRGTDGYKKLIQKLQKTPNKKRTSEKLSLTEMIELYAQSKNPDETCYVPFNATIQVYETFQESLNRKGVSDPKDRYPNSRVYADRLFLAYKRHMALRSGLRRAEPDEKYLPLIPMLDWKRQMDPKGVPLLQTNIKDDIQLDDSVLKMNLPDEETCRKELGYLIDDAEEEQHLDPPKLEKILECLSKRKYAIRVTSQELRLVTKMTQGDCYCETNTPESSLRRDKLGNILVKDPEEPSVEETPKRKKKKRTRRIRSEDSMLSDDEFPPFEIQEYSDFLPKEIQDDPRRFKYEKSVLPNYSRLKYKAIEPEFQIREGLEYCGCKKQSKKNLKRSRSLPYEKSLETYAPVGRYASYDNLQKEDESIRKLGIRKQSSVFKDLSLKEDHKSDPNVPQGIRKILSKSDLYPPKISKLQRTESLESVHSQNSCLIKLNKKLSRIIPTTRRKTSFSEPLNSKLSTSNTRLSKRTSKDDNIKTSNSSEPHKNPSKPKRIPSKIPISLQHKKNTGDEENGNTYESLKPRSKSIDEIESNELIQNEKVKLNGSWEPKFGPPKTNKSNRTDNFKTDQKKHSDSEKTKHEEVPSRIQLCSSKSKPKLNSASTPTPEKVLENPKESRKVEQFKIRYEKNKFESSHVKESSKTAGTSTQTKRSKNTDFESGGQGENRELKRIKLKIKPEETNKYPGCLCDTYKKMKTKEMEKEMKTWEEDMSEKLKKMLETPKRRKSTYSLIPKRLLSLEKRTYEKKDRVKRKLKKQSTVSINKSKTNASVLYQKLCRKTPPDFKSEQSSFPIVEIAQIPSEIFKVFNGTTYKLSSSSSTKKSASSSSLSTEKLKRLTNLMHPNYYQIQFLQNCEKSRRSLPTIRLSINHSREANLNFRSTIQNKIDLNERERTNEEILQFDSSFETQKEKSDTINMVKGILSTLIDDATLLSECSLEESLFSVDLASITNEETGVCDKSCLTSARLNYPIDTIKVDAETMAFNTPRSPPEPDELTDEELLRFKEIIDVENTKIEVEETKIGVEETKIDDKNNEIDVEMSNVNANGNREDLFQACIPITLIDSSNSTIEKSSDLIQIVQLEEVNDIQIPVSLEEEMTIDTTDTETKTKSLKSEIPTLKKSNITKNKEILKQFETLKRNNWELEENKTIQKEQPMPYCNIYIEEINNKRSALKEELVLIDDSKTEFDPEASTSIETNTSLLINSLLKEELLLFDSKAELDSETSTQNSTYVLEIPKEIESLELFNENNLKLGEKKTIQKEQPLTYCNIHIEETRKKKYDLKEELVLIEDSKAEFDSEASTPNSSYVLETPKEVESLELFKKNYSNLRENKRIQKEKPMTYCDIHIEEIKKKKYALKEELVLIDDSKGELDTEASTSNPNQVLEIPKQIETLELFNKKNLKLGEKKMIQKEQPMTYCDIHIEENKKKTCDLKEELVLIDDSKAEFDSEASISNSKQVLETPKQVETLEMFNKNDLKLREKKTIQKEKPITYCDIHIEENKNKKCDLKEELVLIDDSKNEFDTEASTSNLNQVLETPKQIETLELFNKNDLKLREQKRIQKEQPKTYYDIHIEESKKKTCDLKEELVLIDDSKDEFDAEASTSNSNQVLETSKQIETLELFNKTDLKSGKNEAIQKEQSMTYHDIHIDEVTKKRSELKEELVLIDDSKAKFDDEVSTSNPNQVLELLYKHKLLVKVLEHFKQSSSIETDMKNEEKEIEKEEKPVSYILKESGNAITNKEKLNVTSSSSSLTCPKGGNNKLMKGKSNSKKMASNAINQIRVLTTSCMNCEQQNQIYPKSKTGCLDISKSESPSKQKDDVSSILQIDFCEDVFENGTDCNSSFTVQIFPKPIETNENREKGNGEMSVEQVRAKRRSLERKLLKTKPELTPEQQHRRIKKIQKLLKELPKISSEETERRWIKLKDDGLKGKKKGRTSKQVNVDENILKLKENVLEITNLNKTKVKKRDVGVRSTTRKVISSSKSSKEKISRKEDSVQIKRIKSNKRKLKEKPSNHVVNYVTPRTPIGSKVMKRPARTETGTSTNRFDLKRIEEVSNLKPHFPEVRETGEAKAEEVYGGEEMKEILKMFSKLVRLAPRGE